ncbi:MAG: hypothetical protein ACKUBY_01035 [Candidatus Moraniibacteriota bacterium]|jgi:hypothetical protein
MIGKNIATFLTATCCIDNMQYLGTNTILFFLDLYRHKSRDLDNFLIAKERLMTIREMLTALQNQVTMCKDIQRIKQVFESAHCKPIISFMRTEDWFLRGEDIICMVKQDDNTRVPVKCYVANIDSVDEKTIVFLQVKNGYDFLQRDNSYFGMYSAYSPSIMKQWEYNFLLKDKKFAKVWLSNSRSQKYENEIVNLLT